MVNFRRFNGSSDVVTLGLGTAINTITFGTIAVLCRRTDNNSWNGPFSTRSSGLDAEMYIDIAPSSASPANVLWCSFGASQNNNNAFTVATADDWVWVVVTKATGNVAPRYHKYVMSTQTWTRGNGSGNVANATSPSGGSCQIGNAGGDFFNGDIAAVAIWTTALSDATLNTIPNTWTAVLAASPQAAWLLNQASTGTSISDAAVGGANQTALSGTSVQSGTISNWSESGSTPISGTETSASVETASVAATLASSDTATSAEAAPRVAQAATETSSAAEAGTPAATLAATDTAAGTEAGDVADGTADVSGSDSSGAADSAVVIATLAGVDTAGSTEAGSIALGGEDTGQSKSGTDSAAGTEAATKLEVHRDLSANDSLPDAVESCEVVAGSQSVSESDLSAAVDSGSVAVTLAGTDTTAGIETSTLVVAGRRRRPGSVRLIRGGTVTLVGSSRAEDV